MVVGFVILGSFLGMVFASTLWVLWDFSFWAFLATYSFAGVTFTICLVIGWAAICPLVRRGLPASQSEHKLSLHD